MGKKLTQERTRKREEMKKRNGRFRKIEAKKIEMLLVGKRKIK